jgi:hypothetical protein
MEMAAAIPLLVPARIERAIHALTEQPMLRVAVRSIFAAGLAAAILPVAVASAAPAPSPGLNSILASPPTAAYQEVDSSTPGILQGSFDANGYASVGGATDLSKTANALAGDGFIAGFGRAWVLQSSHRLLIELIVAFNGGKGAAGWLGQSEQADLTDPTYQHSLAIDGIDRSYGARMSDTAHYFADAFVFVKGNDGFLVSTISDTDSLGDSAAKQAHVQYQQAPAYTIPPSGWPGAKQPFSLATVASLAPRITAALAAAGIVFWLGVLAWMRARRRRRGAQDAGSSSGL